MLGSVYLRVRERRRRAMGTERKSVEWLGRCLWISSVPFAGASFALMRDTWRRSGGTGTEQRREKREKKQLPWPFLWSKEAVWCYSVCEWEEREVIVADMMWRWIESGKVWKQTRKLCEMLLCYVMRWKLLLLLYASPHGVASTRFFLFSWWVINK